MKQLKSLATADRIADFINKKFDHNAPQCNATVRERNPKVLKSMLFWANSYGAKLCFEVSLCNMTAVTLY